MPQSTSFTVKANGGVLRVLQTQCHVAPAFNQSAGLPLNASMFTAIWDTGATNSVVTQKVVDACALKQTGIKQVFGFNTQGMEPTYLVSIGLPNGVLFSQVEVTKGSLGGGSDVLIGMDIITSGDFVVTNKGGNTIFSFCFPSMRQTDFVEEHNASMRNQRHFQGQDHGHGPRPRRHK